MLSFIKRFKICKKMTLVSCCNENKACITRWKPFKLVKITSLRNKLTVFTNSINPYGELSRLNVYWLMCNFVSLYKLNKF